VEVCDVGEPLHHALSTTDENHMQTHLGTILLHIIHPRDMAFPEFQNSLQHRNNNNNPSLSEALVRIQEPRIALEQNNMERHFHNPVGCWFTTQIKPLSFLIKI
jgi:hypothetical protein